MARVPVIFAKRRLSAGQLRAVAERRFADAECLLESGDPERANGAIYMAGFVIGRLLKALLLERHPNLRKPVDPAKLSTSDREVFGYLYGHDLDKMLGALPELAAKLSVVSTSEGSRVWPEFRTLCEHWTVYARYSPVSAKPTEARNFLITVKEVKRWLKEL